MSYILHTYPWLKYFPLAVSREYRGVVEEMSFLFSCSLDKCHTFFTHILGQIFSSFCFQRVSNRCRGEVFFVQLFTGYVHSSRISLAQIFSSNCFQRVSKKCRGEVFLVQLFIGYVSYIHHAYFGLGSIYLRINGKVLHCRKFKAEFRSMGRKVDGMKLHTGKNTSEILFRIINRNCPEAARNF